jgi:hypothetical protein
MHHCFPESCHLITVLIFYSCDFRIPFILDPDQNPDPECILVTVQHTQMPPIDIASNILIRDEIQAYRQG